MHGEHAYNVKQIYYFYSNKKTRDFDLLIKTHDSKSRGQEEVGHTRRTSELFTRSIALKFVNALNKPP